MEICFKFSNIFPTGCQLFPNRYALLQMDMKTKQLDKTNFHVQAFLLYKPLDLFPLLLLQHEMSSTALNVCRKYKTYICYIDSLSTIA